MTADTITTAQIEALLTDAGEAGDMAMVATCEVALYGVNVDRSGVAATPDEWAVAIERGARSRCAEVIADAKAME